MNEWSIEDQLAIRNLYAAYTFAVDDGETEKFVDCFTPDAEIEAVGFEFLNSLAAGGQAPFLNTQGKVVGSEAIRALFSAGRKAFLGGAPDAEIWLHLTSNVWITHLEEGRAEAQAAFVVFAKDGLVEHFGRYMDKLARCADGRWRFSARRDVGRYERRR